MIAPSVAQGAPPPLLRQFCPTGSSAGQCSVPRGIGVDQTSGDVYVADNNNKRIEKFSPWGVFLRAWGGQGSGPSQFGNLGPQGVAVDSEGEVYVVDWTNRRVQKFGPEGEFQLMFGGEVNETKVEEVGATEAERNLCPVDPGDVCQAGTEGTGKGQFGFWRLGSYIAVDPRDVENAADDVIYVGDDGRVQEFDTEGHYIGDLPDEVPKQEGTVNSLAVNAASGELYLGFFGGSSGESKPDVHKLSTGGEEICTIQVHNPNAVAVGSGAEVYVVDGTGPVASGLPREIARFNSNCGGKELLLDKEDVNNTKGKNQFSTNPTGIAASSACGIEGADLLISNPDQEKSFVNLYGPTPNGKLCPPPPLPPQIKAQHAVSVGNEGATVRAQVNPRFWPDTSYYVQYGTGKCNEGGCDKTALFPGALLGAGSKDGFFFSKGVFLGASEALLPDTTYHYRFIAQSRLDSEGNLVNENGGPVYGEDPDGEGPGEADPGDGLEGTFHTFPSPSQAKEDCANQEFRTGPSAPLPDCRAYELVSPIDKNNGDLARPRLEVLDQSAPSGEALTFTAFNAFAEPEAAPLYGQYMAQRDPEVGWSARSINAPRRSVELVHEENLLSRFKAFSEDLCSGWLLQDTDVPLVEGAVPRGVANLYRNRGLHEGCGPGDYQLLSTVFPPGYNPEVEKNEGKYYPEIQGFSSDGGISVFRAAAALGGDPCNAPNEGRGIFHVYLSQDGTPGVPPRLVSVLPGGEAACTHSSVGTSQSFTGVNTRSDSLDRAVSADGSRVFWTATQSAVPPGGAQLQAGNEPGEIYLRLNPTQPQSDFVHGSARGKGDLIGPAAGTGKSTKNSEVLTEVEFTSGTFAPGQEISASSGNIPAGATITKVDVEEEKEGKKIFKLTLSAKATGTKAKDVFTGAASEIVSSVITEAGAFEVGQSITGGGVPVGTTIVAVNEAENKLTLSAKASQTQTQATLHASSPCSEPAAACTLPVSAEGEGLSGTSASRYLSAAADGSVAIFSTGEDLYEFNVAKALAEEPATTLIAHKVRGLMGAGSDASSVYFVSEEELEGEVSEELEGSAGQPNLYLYRRGGGFTFIATLGGTDVTVGETGIVSSPIEIRPFMHTSRVSSDGLHATFVSASSALAKAVADGYDNLDASSGKPDSEVYLYDAGANGGKGQLICASCNPSGARPAGQLSEAGNDIWIAARIPGWVTSMHSSNVLSVNGQRLFFESFEALVPRDNNGRQDVYEWERVAGKEQCLQEMGGELFVPSTGGCLSLISSGKGSTDVEFVDASADGHDVFFFTNASLLPQDPDFQDIYDAREGGGFPTPPTPNPPCEGDACQSPASPPDEPTPASAATQRSGNLVPSKGGCAKNKRRVKSHGKTRCVPKHKRHHKRKAAKS